MIKGIQKKLLEDFEIFEADNIDGTDNDDGEKVLPSDVQHGFKSKVISKDIINPMLQELEVSGDHINPTEQQGDIIIYETILDDKKITVEYINKSDRIYSMDFYINFSAYPNKDNKKLIFKIYSYVINVLKSFIKHFDPRKLIFSGATNEQNEIYSLLIKMLSNSIKDIDYIIKNNGISFELIKQEKTNESILNELDISNLGYIKPDYKNKQQYIYKTVIDNNKVSMGIEKNSKGIWNVAFEINGDFDSNSENAGISMKVYGFVISCIKSFIKDEQPNVIEFYGFDGNQDKVYGLLLRSLKGYLSQNNYNVEKNGRVYYIKKDEDIQEMKRFAGL